MVEGRQEDAEEFLTCLLNMISDEMLGLLKLTEVAEPGSEEDVAGAGQGGGAAAEAVAGVGQDWQVLVIINIGSLLQCLNGRINGLLILISCFRRLELGAGLP